jgi:ankyrin repeat protein
VTFENRRFSNVGACTRGHLQLAKLMIEEGANNWNEGFNNACVGGHLELVNLMIEMGANDWNEGLYWACNCNHIKLVNLIISKGATQCDYCKKSIQSHIK